MRWQRWTVPALLSQWCVDIRRWALRSRERRVVVAAVIRDGSRVLIQQRAFPVAVAGRWELPGGRVEEGEDEAASVVRECREELGVDVLVGDRVGVDVPISGERFLLRAYLAEVICGIPVAREHGPLRWLTAGELDTVDWLPADRVLIPAVRDLLTGST